MEFPIDSLLAIPNETMQVGDAISFTMTIMIAVVFGILLYFLYTLYFHENEPQDGSLARSLILLVPALTATFWLIQSSVILSLGLMGSMSFVRFRTPVKRAEDVTFVVIALAVAISCGTQNYLIGIILISFLFIFSLLKNSIFRRSSGTSKYAVVTFNSSSVSDVNLINECFKVEKLSADFVSARSYDGITSFIFHVAKMSKEKHEKIAMKLASLDSEASYNIFYPNDRIGV